MYILRRKRKRKPAEDAQFMGTRDQGIRAALAAQGAEDSKQSGVRVTLHDMTGRTIKLS